jgi:hypothetical protein
VLFSTKSEALSFFGDFGFAILVYLSCFGCFDEVWRVALSVECWDFVIFAVTALIDRIFSALKK